jgi:hypothetical protein
MAATLASDEFGEFKVRHIARIWDGGGDRSTRACTTIGFLERIIVRVAITTLWQIGYSVNHNVRVGQIRPDERYKEGAIFPGPERARISWGKSHAGSGSLGGRTL